MPIEEWRDIPGFKNYQVSNVGRVRSLGHFAPYRDSKRWHKGTVKTPVPNPKGYQTVLLYRGEKKFNRLIHRLVLTAFDRLPLPGEEACHINGDPSDNRVQNLRWGTSSENKTDQVRHGTHKNTRKTHCPRNHPLIAPNLRAAALRIGRRECLSCARARDRISRTPAYANFTLQELSDHLFKTIMEEN